MYISVQEKVHMHITITLDVQDFNAAKATFIKPQGIRLFILTKENPANAVTKYSLDHIRRVGSSFDSPNNNHLVVLPFNWNLVP